MAERKEREPACLRPSSAVEYDGEGSGVAKSTDFSPHFPIDATQ
jgi:hypothetical protein